ncbi:unnamed protein product [Danaus chrysippus]|uniref:(African queen) hypothetical protein n=1 Tax=Danaus chrysippus TaxID=151541 RepID=A0A8J2R6Z0_9NEOP|nr:unnamed protein product [Danaus chrysippus]
MEVLRSCLLLSVSVLVFVSAQSPRCPLTADPDLCVDKGSALDEYFFVIKGKTWTIKYDLKELSFTCREDLQLDSEGLPRFTTLTMIPVVSLTACAPPAIGLAAALKTLNVTVRGGLVLDTMPATPTLTSAHLHGLELRAFELSAPPAPAPFLEPEDNFLEPLEGLLDLRLVRVTLTLRNAQRFPVGLRKLILYHANLTTLPAEVFARLPDLVDFLVVDEMLQKLDVSMAPALRSVSVVAPLNGITLGSRVDTATLKKIRSAEIRGNCSGLRSLSIEELNVPPPTAWLAGCGVRELLLRTVSPGALGAGELRGARDLLRLQIQGCGLRILPPDWVPDSSRLKILDLSENELETIPSEIISTCPRLSEMILSNNLLKASVVKALVAARLTKLVLDGNPLGDLCSAGAGLVTAAMSTLWDRRELIYLSLQSTGVTHICHDWCRLPKLKQINLRYNNISKLEFEDLQWLSAVVVDLRGNPVKDVSYSQEQYENVLVAPVARDSTSAVIRLDSHLRCDCNEYWYSLALRARPQHGQASVHAICENEKTLISVPPTDLLCEVPELCPDRCKCKVDGERSHVSCPNAGLVALPTIPLLPPLSSLSLPGNDITIIDFTNISTSVKLLNLTNNQIKHIDAVTVATLFADNRRVLLDGNPLSCECRDVALQRELASRAEAGEIGDSRRHCRDVAEAACAMALWALPASILVLSAAVIAACLVRPAARRRLKLFLFERGMCVRWALGAAPDAVAEAAREYDAFVSFSHHDSEFAAAIAERLERGPRARRLCLHERDWTPGEWIPEQIATSVRNSRRTVALVSESFLASQWARAELREAYTAALREGRARLLAVLLPGMEPPRAATAPELRAYLAAVTYLRWDDPHFWDKLLLAVPPPPNPSPAPASPPTLSSPPPPP